MPARLAPSQCPPRTAAAPGRPPRTSPSAVLARAMRLCRSGASLAPHPSVLMPGTMLAAGVPCPAILPQQCVKRLEGCRALRDAFSQDTLVTLLVFMGNTFVKAIALRRQLAFLYCKRCLWLRASQWHPGVQYAGTHTLTTVVPPVKDVVLRAGREGSLLRRCW